jgi:sulfoxide reductase catalytic subunit YedY
MLIRRAPDWEILEALATPEDIYLNRRSLIVGAGSIAAAGTFPATAFAAEDPTADLYPAKRNRAFKLSRVITPEKINSRYNNFYEFGSHKKIWKKARALKIRPWEVKIDGDVEKPFTIGIDELIRKMTLEERLYRHRCVEAWSMTIPWTGFPMKKLVALARPLSRARYVRMETFHDPEIAPGQKASWYPWPYVEGLTIAEATNELAFLVTGAYGKPMAKQFGAPLRLAVPWKYGFKHIKSITRISFTRKRPKTFWEEVQGKEYGFWANVNPKVDHRRWSQATERDLATGVRIPTKLYNGYAAQVAHMYKGMDAKKLFF